VQHRNCLQVVLNFQTSSFCITCTFLHYNSHPLIRLLCAKFGLCTRWQEDILSYCTVALYNWVANCILCLLSVRKAYPSGHVVEGVGLRLHACLLRLQVSILPGAWMSVSCKCCVLSGRGLCDSPITCLEESYGVWYVRDWDYMRLIYALFIR